MRPVGATRSERPPLGEMPSLVLVIDTTNTKSGSSGTLLITRVAFAQMIALVRRVLHPILARAPGVRSRAFAALDIAARPALFLFRLERPRSDAAGAASAREQDRRLQHGGRDLLCAARELGAAPREAVLRT